MLLEIEVCLSVFLNMLISVTTERIEAQFSLKDNKLAHEQGLQYTHHLLINENMMFVDQGQIKRNPIKPLCETGQAAETHRCVFYKH